MRFVTNKGELKMHIKTCHTKPGICSPKSKKMLILNEEPSPNNDVKMLDYAGNQDPSRK